MEQFCRNTGVFYLNGIWIVITLLGCLLTAPVLFAQEEKSTTMVSSDATACPDLSCYYAFANFFLTGEHRDYDLAAGDFGRVSPNANVTEGGPGAWVIAARYWYLDLNESGVAGGELSDITGGVNWYLNPGMRMMFNYVYADLEDRPGV